MSKRITYKYLVQFLNEEFKRFEITEFEVVKVERTHHRDCDYEAGATKLLIHFEPKDKSKKHPLINGIFYCFYFVKELQWYVDNGYKLKLDFAYRSSRMMLCDLELNVTKL